MKGLASTDRSTVRVESTGMFVHTDNEKATTLGVSSLYKISCLITGVAAVPTFSAEIEKVKFNATSLGEVALTKYTSFG